MENILSNVPPNGQTVHFFKPTFVSIHWFWCWESRTLLLIFDWRLPAEDKRKTDINEPHLTMCPSSSLFYSYFSVMGALKDRMLRLMVGLQWTASHESILLPRGWLISVEAIRHPRYPFPTQHDSVVNYSYSRDEKH